MQGVEEICLIVNSTIFTKLKLSASKKKYKFAPADYRKMISIGCQSW